MRPKAGFVLTIVSVVLLVFAFAGCGGGSKSASPTTEATTTEETTTTEATETTETTETETTETTQTSSLGNFTAGKCKELAESAQNFSSSLSGGNFDFQKVAQDYQKFAEQAPSEIKDDVQVLADAVQKYADALKGVDLTSTNPDPATLQKLQKLSTEIDTQKLTQASQNITNWVQKNCT